MARIKILKDKNDKIIYPQSHTYAVYDVKGEMLQNVLDRFLVTDDVAQVPTVDTEAELKSNKTLVINRNSADTQYPSAKAVYDAIIANKEVGIKMIVVSALPVEGIQENAIYLVPDPNTTEQNIYNQYVYANNGWIAIGSTQTDFSDYVRVDELANVAKTNNYNDLDNLPNIEGKEEKSNKTTVIDETSTNVQYPSAKAVFLAVNDLTTELETMLGNLTTLTTELGLHQANDERHLSEEQISKINSIVDATQALAIANQAITTARADIELSAVSTANTYTMGQVEDLRKEFDDKIGDLDLPTVVDPDTGEEKQQGTFVDILEDSPAAYVNPEDFYKFKNVIENASFEVFDGSTLIPLGWNGGQVSAEASMFETYSLMIQPDEVAAQTKKYMAHVDWLKGAYDTNKGIFCFYHKGNPVKVEIVNEKTGESVQIAKLNEKLQEVKTGNSLTFEEKANWDKHREKITFNLEDIDEYIQIKFTGLAGEGDFNAAYIDGPSLEPWELDTYPSIYKPGRYAISAYQILNPTPADVDRFTSLEHFDIANSVYDDKGNITSQDLLRRDGSLAIHREASNPDSNGYYQTIVETFYLKDGSVNYIDTYSYTYSATGAILSRNMTTTEI